MNARDAVMKKLLVQVGCWGLLSGVFAGGAIYAWMLFTIAGATMAQVMEMVRFAAIVVPLWLLFERMTRRARVRSAGQPTPPPSL